jgi:hypothetical protein
LLFFLVLVFGCDYRQVDIALLDWKWFCWIHDALKTAISLIFLFYLFK